VWRQVLQRDIVAAEGSGENSRREPRQNRKDTRSSAQGHAVLGNNVAKSAKGTLHKNLALSGQQEKPMQVL